ncbi:hypothetical protein [Atlantibacter hermannii]|uniref:hypothetical protein n=1 Tax=Atlantibacter hermannii TaxID=565 RepID=UPI00164FEA45|nr:hypothetical protein [Atlantibacter hermannii]
MLGNLCERTMEIGFPSGYGCGRKRIGAKYNLRSSLKANQTKYATQVQKVPDFNCTRFGGCNDMAGICSFNDVVRFLMFEKGSRNPCCT